MQGKFLVVQMFNILAPGRCGSNFKNVMSKHMQCDG